MNGPWTAANASRSAGTLGGSREVPKYTSHQELPRSDRRADTGRNGAESGKTGWFSPPRFHP